MRSPSLVFGVVAAAGTIAAIAVGAATAGNGSAPATGDGSAPDDVRLAAKRAGAADVGPATTIGRFSVWYTRAPVDDIVSVSDESLGGIGPPERPEHLTISCGRPEPGESLHLCGGTRWQGSPPVHVGTARPDVTRVVGRFIDGRSATGDVVNGLFVIEGAQPRPRLFGVALESVTPIGAKGRPLGAPQVIPGAHEPDPPPAE